MFRSSAPSEVSSGPASMKKTNGAPIHQPPCIAALTISGKINSGRKWGRAFQIEASIAPPPVTALAPNPLGSALSCAMAASHLPKFL